MLGSQNARTLPTEQSMSVDRRLQSLATNQSNNVLSSDLGNRLAADVASDASGEIAINAS